MKLKRIKAKNLEPGMTVILKDNKMGKIKRVNASLVPNAVDIKWSDGCFDVVPNSEVFKVIDE